MTKPDRTGDLLAALFWNYNTVAVDDEGEAHIVGRTRPLLDLSDDYEAMCDRCTRTRMRSELESVKRNGLTIYLCIEGDCEFQP